MSLLLVLPMRWFGPVDCGLASSKNVDCPGQVENCQMLTYQTERSWRCWWLSLDPLERRYSCFTLMRESYNISSGSNWTATGSLGRVLLLMCFSCCIRRSGEDCTLIVDWLAYVQERPVYATGWQEHDDVIDLLLSHQRIIRMRCAVPG